MRLRWRQLTASEHLGLWLSTVLALVSLAGFATDPRSATLCLLFFGGGAVFMLHLWRREAVTEATAEIAALVLSTGRHDLPGYQRLIPALTPLRGARAAAALAGLQDCAKSLDGLFLHARRRELAGLPEPGDTPLSWALASLHPDGHVREAAVNAMGRQPQSVFAPFLVERAVDHVGAVRSAALAGLRALLADESAWMPVARSYRRVAGRRHADALAELLGPQVRVHDLAPVCCRFQGVYCGISFGQSCDFVDRQPAAGSAGRG
ncbi:hypothetical protein [Actinoplanes sp. L3-i22]|uniref:hypothetical protein n=1 Tax=Actinoplanes sp. L3-i22 TaxID=2836373 RepID=UPI001C74CD90|nr:hypothetical protein [Actinoplanes sp. L3-i22]BCY09061.1 hypothetical protein L3i22_041490 [Actinoplanes sp. L3-i22]